MRRKQSARRGGVSLTAVVKSKDREIRELKERLESALEMATTDQLTGALNRHGFYERFTALHAHATRQSKRVGSILLLDIDFFKAINDTHGHLAGDSALSALADIVRQELRREDLLFRYGGEEFIVLMPDAEIREAVTAAERLRSAVESGSFSFGSASFRFTISIGVAAVKAVSESAEDDFRKGVTAADRETYNAKEAGRNCVRFSDND
jgi:diguanylate cyclase (GGDEF)-like protein